MNRYYFSFSENHIDTKGDELKDYYIIVEAENFVKCMIKFYKWSSKNLPYYNQFNTYFEESNFIKSFYKKGLYVKL